jgi:hypothetical protein
MLPENTAYGADFWLSSQRGYFARQVVMNEEIGYALINAEIQRLGQLTYSELVQRMGTQTDRIVGEDGKIYQVESEVRWDNTKNQDIRIIVAADDGGRSALKPLIGGFIMHRDGAILRESFR